VTAVPPESSGEPPGLRSRGDEVRLRPGEFRQAGVRVWLIRFAFGAGVSALAGLVSAFAGPRVGGLFLAFPAILLASLTLVAKEEGLRQARNDARGAVLGTLGLIGFAVVAAVTLTRWTLWAALGAASIAWTIVALGGYPIAHRIGVGGDESPDA
jgi:uncharacterized membrane protein (GlpM family)